MNHSDLIDQIATRAGIKKHEARLALSAVAATVGLAVGNGDDIAIPGLGKFKVVDRPARSGVTPLTGEPYSKPAHRAVKFSAAAELKRRANGEGK